MIRATTVAMCVLIGVSAEPPSSVAADEFAASGKLVEDRAALLSVRLKLRQTDSVDVNGVRIDLDSPPDGSWCGRIWVC